jgi:UDP-galactopyranose mutase
MRYDYLIVGAGFFGSVFAREMTDAGASCLVIDKRNHIGGNCYTENVGGINVHKYGAHIFHTNSRKIWEYVNRFAEFNHYRHTVKANSSGEIYSFPINMMTFYQMWGVTTPKQAMDKIFSVRETFKEPSNLEEWVLSKVGREIYEKFIYGYTKKNWGREPIELPASIIKRIPIRYTYDDSYFFDRYQGIPIGGYTAIFDGLLEGIALEMGVDFLKDRERLEGIAEKIVYTGSIDELFDCDEGRLEWRSTKFTQKEMDGDYQGGSIINYTDEKIPFTRITEHKHFEFGSAGMGSTVITHEYPQKWSPGKIKIYPINNKKNEELYKSYKKRISSKYILGGRLAEYRYYDMHQVVASSLNRVSYEKK